MKKVNIKLNCYYLSDCSFRNKIDIIKLCINYARFAAISFNEKMSQGIKRLFAQYGNSIHSMHYPFDLGFEDDRIVFYYQDNELDAKVTSILLGFFEGFDELESMEDMYENFLWITDEYGIHDAVKENALWKLICHLLIFEPAYLR